MLLHNLIFLIIFIKNLQFKIFIEYLLNFILFNQYYNYLFNTFFKDILVKVVFLLMI